MFFHDMLQQRGGSVKIAGTERVERFLLIVHALILCQLNSIEQSKRADS
jgi:hypothetical protein